MCTTVKNICERLAENFHLRMGEYITGTETCLLQADKLNYRNKDHFSDHDYNCCYLKEHTYIYIPLCNVWTTSPGL